MPSPSYILTRLLQIIPTFLFIMVVVFVLVRLLPGDPASAILGERATDEAVDADQSPSSAWTSRSRSSSRSSSSGSCKAISAPRSI